MEKTLDFSPAKLESQPMWKRRLWQLFFVFGVLIAIAGTIYILIAPDEPMAWQMLQIGTYSLLLLPATGWFYHKYSYYIHMKEDVIEIKQFHKKKETLSTGEIENISFRNNHLFVDLKNGEEMQFDFSRNTFKYKEIQDIKEQIEQFNKSRLN